MSAGNQIAEDAATACIALLEAKSKAVRESAKQAACLHLNVVSHNPGFHRLDALTFAAIIADQDELECNHGVKILLRWAGEGGSLSDVASTAVPRLVNAFNQSSDASKSVLRSVFMEALQHVLVDAPKLQIDWLSEVDGILFEAVQHYHVKNGGRELVCHQELSTLSAQDLLRILAALSKESVPKVLQAWKLSRPGGWADLLQKLLWKDDAAACCSSDDVLDSIKLCIVDDLRCAVVVGPDTPESKRQRISMQFQREDQLLEELARERAKLAQIQALASGI
eukprot:TRINITY_DN2520_c0_g1_i1.p1 TRINITY_DN2520_c0_g1~~TRINITY_DN2520_c0_g1_i1.p1  ORF type:complete len:281 (-),score=79.33 TRINITY_DN2520_c0_g1_i1:278-1120(-)